MTVAPTSPIDTTSLTTRYMCAQTDWTFDTLYWAYQEQTGYPAPSTSVHETVVPSTSTPSTVTSSTSTSSKFTSSISTSLPTSTSTTLPDSTTSDQSGSSLSGGAIAGIVIGCFAAALLLAGFLLRRYRLPPFSKKIDPTNQLLELPEQNQVHEIGSSGSPPQKSNTVYEIGS
ncbi:hypothetical protein PEX1_084120 [Penicillium expansum]|nr:hypothetical protein PEX1_084120 [Penicillium expansum]